MIGRREEKIWYTATRSNYDREDHPFHLADCSEQRLTYLEALHAANFFNKECGLGCTCRFVLREDMLADFGISLSDYRVIQSERGNPIYILREELIPSVHK